MICVCMCIYIFTNRSIYRNDIQKEVCVSMYDHPGVDNRIELSRTKKCGRTPQLFQSVFQFIVLWKERKFVKIMTLCFFLLVLDTVHFRQTL